MDFTAETAVNTRVGYHSRVALYNYHTGNTTSDDGCFEIWWGN
jgi:hypothetical protein